MHLRLSNIGQINEADIHFGDLTVLVGPQATGKSIALQFLKLAVDMGYVQDEMRRHGLDWSGELPQFFDAYFGEGMRAIWRAPASELRWNGRVIDLPSWIGWKRRDKVENLFYIPAQRVLALRNGWPRPFTDYAAGDPFAVRDFSEKLRILVERFGEQLFPVERRLKVEFRQLLERDVFAKFRLEIDKAQSQKRLVLGSDHTPLPYMVWSAGQREFVPLLLGLYWLMPPTKVTRRADIQWAVIEELEMGLHPRAINVVLLMILELVARGYRVCLSTHSPQVLEMVWAMRHLRESGASWQAYLEMFEAPKVQNLQEVIEKTKNKQLKVYYFDSATGRAHDISELEPDGEAVGESSWGGLSEFSGRANAAVARAVANAGT
ncbi:MAG: ATP-binding protein [Pirellulales bacterium]|nr:ATP-binding protein [Pirellulales bacterium]